MSRGNARMGIFLDDADYHHFIHVLGEVVGEFGLECWNYCLMPNHYHLTLQPLQPNLSEAIRRLNSVYALWWNRRHQRVGHVFQGRFKSQIVDREEYLLTLSRYVVTNPVRAGLVQRPEDWTWSSYRATAGLGRAPAFLNTDATLRLFGDGPAVRQQARFASAMAASSTDVASVERIRSNESILGPRTFKMQIAEGGIGP